jgi:hypothetical protein
MAIHQNVNPPIAPSKQKLNQAAGLPAHHFIKRHDMNNIIVTDIAAPPQVKYIQCLIFK